MPESLKKTVHSIFASIVSDGEASVIVSTLAALCDRVKQSSNADTQVIADRLVLAAKRLTHSQSHSPSDIAHALSQIDAQIGTSHSSAWHSGRALVSYIRSLSLSCTELSGDASTPSIASLFKQRDLLVRTLSLSLSLHTAHTHRITA
jgi:hypothetical protein